MSRPNSFLIDWSIHYIKNRDHLKKEIINIEKRDAELKVLCKGRTASVIVETTLSPSTLQKINQRDNVSCITLNSKTNLTFVVQSWEKLILHMSLKIYFVNPFSAQDKVWIINPRIHDLICDRASLGLGLKAMAEMVDTIDEAKFEERIK